MASIATDMMLTKLVRPEEMLSRLDPKEMVKAIGDPLMASVEDLIHETAARHAPGLWEAAPEAIRRRIIQRVQDDAPDAVAAMLADLRQNMDKVFDLKATVVNNLVRDKHILNKIFQEVGRQEFRFIAHSGIMRPETCIGVSCDST